MSPLTKPANEEATDLGESLEGVSLDGGPWFESAARALTKAFRAECCCAMRPMLAAQGWALDRAHFHGFPPGVDPAERVLELLRGLSSPLALAAVLPDRTQRPLAELTPSAVAGVRDALRRLEVPNRDVMCLAVCDGATLLAWVALLRRGDFTGAEQRVLDRLVPVLRRRLALGERLRQAELAEASLGAVLEALAEPALVVRGDGRVVAANAAAAALSLDPSSLQVERFRAGPTTHSNGRSSWRTTPLDSEEQPRGFLVVRRETGSDATDVTSVMHAAARRWGLTRTESRVLGELARGSSNKQIARSLDSSVRTIELHVSSILKKSALGSRAAVVAYLSGAVGK